MRLQLFRSLLARNSESLLGFPTFSREAGFSLRDDCKRIVYTRRSRYPGTVKEYDGRFYTILYDDGITKVTDLSSSVATPCRVIE